MTGYLLRAFTDDYRPKETDYNQQKTNGILKAQRQQELEQKKEKRQKTLLKAFINRKNEEVELAMRSIEDNKMEELKEVFLIEFKSNDIFRKILNAKGFDSSLVQVQWKKFLATLLLNESTSSLDYFENHIFQKDSISI